MQGKQITCTPVHKSMKANLMVQQTAKGPMYPVTMSLLVAHMEESSAEPQQEQQEQPRAPAMTHKVRP
jgi:hypothetical protein